MARGGCWNARGGVGESLPRLYRCLATMLHTWNWCRMVLNVAWKILKKIRLEKDLNTKKREKSEFVKNLQQSQSPCLVSELRLEGYEWDGYETAPTHGYKCQQDAYSRSQHNTAHRPSPTSIYFYMGLISEEWLLYILNAWREIKRIFCDKWKWCEIPISVSTNKMILAHSHIHLSVSSLSDCFQVTMAELTSCDRNCMNC